MTRQPGKRKKDGAKEDATAGLPPLNLHAAGIDVGSAAHYVAVPADRDAEPVRKFGSFTADLHRMARWLKDCRIKTVVMQSTGVYWMVLYETDVQECQWLQKLHTFGLLNNSFRPPEEIRALRGYLRQRENLVAAAATCIQHIHPRPEFPVLDAHKELFLGRPEKRTDAPESATANHACCVRASSFVVVS